MIATRQRLEVLAESRGLELHALGTDALRALVAEIESTPDASNAPFPPAQPIVPRQLLAKRAGGTGGGGIAGGGAA